jgi:hypothetical protein
VRKEAVDSFRSFRCGTCLQEALICSRCDRGNRYCSPACSKEARRKQCRAARHRYQSSQRGAEKHRQHQRAYEKRRLQKDSQKSLMDHSSLRAPTSSHSLDVTQEPTKRCCMCSAISNGVTRIGWLRSVQGERNGYKQGPHRRNNSPPPC